MALMLGALTAFASHSPKAPPAPKCKGCISGVMNWHPILNMTDSNGNQCEVILTIWIRDGSCRIEEKAGEPPTIACVERLFCQFWITSFCTCGPDCQDIGVSMYNLDGTLVFSMDSQGGYIFGMSCDSMEYVMFVAYNNLTGESFSQMNGFSCSECKLKDPDGDDSDG